MNVFQKRVSVVLAALFLLLFPCAGIALDVYDETLVLSALDVPDDAPEFVEYTALMTYLTACAEDCRVHVPMKLSNALLDVFSGNEKMPFDFRTIEISSMHTPAPVPVMMRIGYSQGTRIASAYLRGNTAFLNENERTVYNQAVHFLETIYERNATEVARERQIHDFVCDRLTYDRDMLRAGISYDAADALLAGRAVCSGYADAMTMLLRMAGFRAQTVIGQAYGGEEWSSHAWNAVMIGGEWVFVDATWNDDLSARYAYFNMGLADIERTHKALSLYMDGSVAYFSGDAYAYYNHKAFPELRTAFSQSALSEMAADELDGASDVTLSVLCMGFTPDVALLLDSVALSIPPGSSGLNISYSSLAVLDGDILSFTISKR